MHTQTSDSMYPRQSRVCTSAVQLAQLNDAKDKIVQLTIQLMELEDFKRYTLQDGQNFHLKMQQHKERMEDLEKTEAKYKLALETVSVQNQQISMLCEEKDAWQKEKTLLEDICLDLKRKTQSVCMMGGRKFELGKMKRQKLAQQEDNTENEFSSATLEVDQNVEKVASLPSPAQDCLENLQVTGMTEAKQTIETQGSEISRLKESLQDLQKTVEDHEADIQKLSEQNLLLVKEADLQRSTNLNLQKQLSKSRSLLTAKTTEVLQIQTNFEKPYYILMAEHNNLRIALHAEQAKRKCLEEINNLLVKDQKLLEDICLQMKKRLLGIFGRRMEDRDTEMAKMRRKMPGMETERGVFHRIFRR